MSEMIYSDQTQLEGRHMWPFRRNPNKWDLIGSSQKADGIPRWVLSTFAEMPGSHGTRLIDYPFPMAGESVYLKGRTYRYRIDLGERSWRVYRKRRHSRQ